MWCLSSPVGFPGGSDSKESASNAGDLGSIPGLGRYTGEGNGNPLQCSCLENSMDRGAWQTMGLQRVRYDWATNTFTFTSHLELHLSCWLPFVACHEFISVTEICIFFFFLTKTLSSFFFPFAWGKYYWHWTHEQPFRLSGNSLLFSSLFCGLKE